MYHYHVLSVLICFFLSASSGSFSVGIRYEYYDPNKSSFVSPKYETLQEEILDYYYINVKQYRQDIIPKSNAYYQTNLRPSGMSKEQIIVIILYTDYSDLSAHFTSTFRKSNAFEPLSATKRRHRQYYWMGKILRESMEAHGSSYSKGPFYCGMSTTMTMPEFTIMLFSPTSTSCHIEVAIQFSGEDGLIIEFNNHGGHAKYIHALDVSWLSRFKEEDERYNISYACL